MIIHDSKSVFKPIDEFLSSDMTDGISLVVKTTKKGFKFDQGKPRTDLIEPEWLDEMAKILTLGAVNHGDRNWMNVEPYRIEGALLRHYIAAKSGKVINEEIDKNGTVHLVNHWGQIAINALFRMSQEFKRENVSHEIDITGIPKGKVAGIGY